jgi:hypothetical protein
MQGQVEKQPVDEVVSGSVTVKVQREMIALTGVSKAGRQ